MVVVERRGGRGCEKEREKTKRIEEDEEDHGRWSRVPWKQD